MEQNLYYLPVNNHSLNKGVKKMQVELIEKKGFEFSHIFNSWQARLTPLTESQFEVKLVDNNIESPASLIFKVKNARNYEFSQEGWNISQAVKVLNKKHNLNVRY